eukprot:scaffold4061_cov135-Isochrysis_galbana.AAC.1
MCAVVGRWMLGGGLAGLWPIRGADSRQRQRHRRAHKREARVGTKPRQRSARVKKEGARAPPLAGAGYSTTPIVLLLWLPHE